MIVYSTNILDGCTLSLEDIAPRGRIGVDCIRAFELEGVLVPSIKKVIFNPPATIILWEDGTKTVVKTRKGTEFNPYYGFTAAVTKKVCGSNSRVNDFVEHAEWCHKEEK